MASNDTELILRNSEAGIFIGYGNLMPEVGAKVTYSNVLDDTLDPNNLKYPTLDEISRFTKWKIYPDDTTKMYIDIFVELPSTSKINFICIGGIDTNYPSSMYAKAKFRIFYSKSVLSGDFEITEDGELTNSFQDLFLKNTGLDFFDKDFWFGYSPASISSKVTYSPFILEIGKTLRSFKLQIIVEIPEDSKLYGIGETRGFEVFDNDYYIDIANLFVGQYSFFEIDYGWKSTTHPIGTAATPTVGNSVRGNYRGEYDTVDISISDISESEFMFKLRRNILSKRPTFERFFVLTRPTKTEYLYDRAMLAVLSQPPDQTHEYFNGYSTSLQFRETS